VKELVQQLGLGRGHQRAGRRTSSRRIRITRTDDQRHEHGHAERGRRRGADLVGASDLDARASRAQLLATADSIDALNTPSLAGLLGSGRANSFKGINNTIAPPRVKSLVGLPAEGATTLTKPASFTLDVRSVFDPATVNAGTFEMRGDGIDGAFGTGDDVLIPMTLVFGGDNAPDYKVGTNRLFFTIPGPMGSDTYRFSMLATARDPFGQAIDGNGDGTAGDAFTRTFTITGLTNPYRVQVDPGEVVTNAHFGNHDVAAPKVLASSFDFATAQSLGFSFNEDVSASLSLSDLLSRT
jgi:hypothetical protein